MKLFIEYPVDWIVGHLRYGHKEGEIELTEEEYAEFKKDPTAYLNSHKEFTENLDLLVDDYEVNDCSDDIYNVSYKEIIQFFKKPLDKQLKICYNNNR